MEKTPVSKHWNWPKDVRRILIWIQLHPSPKSIVSNLAVFQLFTMFFFISFVYIDLLSVFLEQSWSLGKCYFSVYSLFFQGCRGHSTPVEVRGQFLEFSFLLLPWNLCYKLNSLGLFCQSFHSFPWSHLSTV